MKSSTVKTLTTILDTIGLDGDRIAFKAAIIAYKLGLKKQIDSREPFDFGDFKLFIDPHDTLQVAGHGQFEELEFTTLMSLVKEDTVVFDVGANMGYYSVRIAQKARLGKVYSFEPDPGNFGILTKNIALNQLTNVMARNVALSDKADVLRLWKHPFNVGDYRLYNDGDFKEYVDVPTISLDSVIPERVDLVKIDVQGYEYFVFNGGKKLLSKHHPVIFSEFWPRGLYNSGATPADYLNLIESNGYKPSLIDEDKKQVVETSFDYLREMSAKPVNRYVNLIFS